MAKVVFLVYRLDHYGFESSFWPHMFSHLSHFGEGDLAMWVLKRGESNTDFIMALKCKLHSYYIFGRDEVLLCMRKHKRDMSTADIIIALITYHWLVFCLCLIPITFWKGWGYPYECLRTSIHIRGESTTDYIVALERLKLHTDYISERVKLSIRVWISVHMSFDPVKFWRGWSLCLLCECSLLNLRTDYMLERTKLSIFV